ncbi:MAG: hypothetical protein IJX02_02665 [Clostridia bacterium]|nr:hypothetical protein [Clostridia bacterium]
MKRKITVALLFVCLLVLMVALASCGHEHSFVNDWEGDDNSHWHACRVEGEECTEVSGKAAHTYETISTIAPNCTEAGSKIEKCTVCAKTRKVTVNALGHDYNNEVVAPTCLVGGKTIVTCKREGCTYSSEKDFVDPLGHDLSDRIVAPQCEEQGYTETICSRCDYSDKKNFVEATGHDYYEEIIAPKCDVDGYTSVLCHNCDYSEKKDYVDAKGHTYYMEEDAQKGNHYREQKKPTCTEPGTRQYRCTTCGRYPMNDNNIVEIPALGHGELIENVIKPTCTLGGLTEVTCPNCDLYETKDLVDPLGHTYLKGETAVEGVHYNITLLPGCETEGEKCYICTVCSLQALDDEKGKEKINPTGHNWQVSVEPWCGNDSHTEYICTNVNFGVPCESTKSEKAETEVRHSYPDDGVPSIQETCVDYALFVCKVCYGEFTAYEGDELGQPTGVHVYDVFVQTLPSTCIFKGYTTYSCSAGNCGLTENREYTPYVAHSLTEVTSQGITVCTICNNSYVDITAEKVKGSDAVCVCGKGDACDCGASAEWGGFTEPKEPFAINANEATTFDKVTWNDGDHALNMGYGLIAIESSSFINGTITVYDGEGAVLYTFTVSGTSCFVDLFEYATVEKIVVEVDASAELYLYRALQ